MARWRDLTGQHPRGWPEYVDPHREAAHEYVRQALHDVLADPITHDGVVHHGAVLTPEILAAESHLGGRHTQALRLPPHAAPHTLTAYLSPRRRRELADSWAAHVLRMQGRAAAYLAEIYRVCDQILSRLPVYDSEGRELVDGVPLFTSHARSERERLYREDLCVLIGVSTPRGVAPQLDPALRAQLLRTRTDWDAPALTVATDLVTAHEQLLDRIDVAADAQRRYLLDHSAGPANAAQVTALRLLDSRHQAARRAVRATTTTASAASVATAQIALVRGALVEDAPAWQTSGGSPIAGRRHSVTYTAPTTGAWTLGLRAVHPRRAAATLADLGNVVLDAVDIDGWAVTSTPRAAPHAHERTVTLTRPTDAGAPDAGTHEIPIVARNGIGPSTLTVAVIVPAAASG